MRIEVVRETGDQAEADEFATAWARCPQPLSTRNTSSCTTPFVAMQWPASMRGEPARSVMRSPASLAMTMRAAMSLGGDFALEHDSGDEAVARASPKPP
jgi:hypothetical protein